MATPVTMPKLGLTMVEGTVARWMKAEGDAVSQGELLLEVMTDKINYEVEAPAGGFLRNVAVAEGQTVPVGAELAVIAAAGEIRATPAAKRAAREAGVALALVTPSGPEGRILERDVLAHAAAARPEERESRPEKRPEERAVAEAAAAGREVLAGAGSAARATPLAKKLAAERGVDLAALADALAPARGEGGLRLRAADVALARGEAGSMAASAAGEAGGAGALTVATDERVPLAGHRRIVADRMSSSYRTAPHVTLNADVDMTRMKAARERLNAVGADGGGVKLSYTDLLLVVVARALAEFPDVNASISEDETEIIRHAAVNVGIAVAAPGGLVVAAVRNADRLGVFAAATALHDLVERARTGRLLPEDLTGGTFTITNLGMYGVDSFTPIINPPEGAILGVGRMAERPVVADGAVVACPMMTLSLSFDHRLVDGAGAALFLSRVCRLMEEPLLLLA